MGALIQKLLGGGPLFQLDHIECCNDEVRSSSSSDSWHTHASAHVDTERNEDAAASARPGGELNKLPQSAGTT